MYGHHSQLEPDESFHLLDNHTHSQLQPSDAEQSFHMLDDRMYGHRSQLEPDDAEQSFHLLDNHIHS